MGVSLYTCLPLLVLAIVIARRVARKSSVPLPPGPKPLPFLGNIHQFPRSAPWITFRDWKEKYGDVVYVSVLGKPTVILGSHKACTDLLDRRSSLYSDRPRMVVLNELMGYEWNAAFMKYSMRWRQHRRLFHQYFNEKAAREYLDIQESSTHNLLRRLLQTPDSFLDHIRLSFSDAVLRVMYGIEVENRDNMYVELIERAMVLAGEAAVPGRFLADLIPALKYIPSWFPGAGFRRYSEMVKKYARGSKDLTADFVNEKCKDDESFSPVFSQMVEKCREYESAKPLVDPAVDLAKNTAALAYIAGADTTLASIQTLLLLLANHPDVQRTAQAELDAVVGRDRLPTFEDMQDLPYIQAIVKELLRWHPVAPLSIAHGLTQDDVYEGYMIPKGAVIVPNLWLVLRDPDVYPEPDRFNPSRWLMDTPDGVKLNPKIPDPSAAFGYGRRICAGRYFASNSLFITAASVLACFNISPLDDSGKPCQRLPEAWAKSLIAYPLPFKAAIVPRSENVPRLIVNETVCR